MIDSQNAARDRQAPELRTSRTILRPLRESDVSQLHALWTSPGVRRFLWDDETIPLERTRETVQQSVALFARYGFGLWGMWPADRGALAGFVGLWPFRDPPEFELLYGTAEDLWGHGYAPEIANAVVDYCFESLNLVEVRASTDAPNVASIRVLGKLGFAFVRRDLVDGRDTVFYALRRPTTISAPCTPSDAPRSSLPSSSL